MTLKEYLIELLKGAKTYVDTERSEIASDYAALIGPISQALTDLETFTYDELSEYFFSFIGKERPVTDVEKENFNPGDYVQDKTDIWAKINTNTSDISTLRAEIEKKPDSELILPWAIYDKTNKILQLGVPGSPVYIKSTTAGLEIYQGTTKIAYFEGGHLKATDITTSSSMTTPKITIGGLEISGNSTNGWSFR